MYINNLSLLYFWSCIAFLFGLDRKSSPLVWMLKFSLFNSPTTSPKKTLCIHYPRKKKKGHPSLRELSRCSRSALYYCQLNMSPAAQDAKGAVRTESENLEGWVHWKKGLLMSLPSERKFSVSGWKYWGNKWSKKLKHLLTQLHFGIL